MTFGVVDFTPWFSMNPKRLSSKLVVLLIVHQDRYTCAARCAAIQFPCMINQLAFEFQLRHAITSPLKMIHPTPFSTAKSVLGALGRTNPGDGSGAVHMGIQCIQHTGAVLCQVDFFLTTCEWILSPSVKSKREQGVYVLSYLGFLGVTSGCGGCGLGGSVFSQCTVAFEYR